MDRTCALVPRALTGEHDGQVVKMSTPTDAQSMQLKVEQLQTSSFNNEGATRAGEMEATTIAITTLLRCPGGKAIRDTQVQISDMTATAPGTQSGSGEDDLCFSNAWLRANLAKGLPSFINFVSMDVEGLELEILRFWPFKDVRVGAWYVQCCRCHKA